MLDKYLITNMIYIIYFIYKVEQSMALKQFLGTTPVHDL